MTREASFGFALTETEAWEANLQYHPLLTFPLRIWCAGMLMLPCALLTHGVRFLIQIKRSDDENRLLYINENRDIRRKSSIIFASSGVAARMPTVRDVSNIMLVMQNVVPEYNLMQVRQSSPSLYIIAR